MVDLLREIQGFSIEEEPYKTIVEEDINRYLFDEKIDGEVFLYEKQKCILC